MESRLHLDISHQPNDTTCGPTCLHAIYDYYGDRVPLDQVIAEVRPLDDGGTLGVLLALHAQRRGYHATIYPYNLVMFDPTWFELSSKALIAKLEEQRKHKSDRKLLFTTDAYLEFLSLGGWIRFRELTTRFIRETLAESIPILTGLSATYLHRTPREIGDTNHPDDIRGEPVGHFVVLCGYDRRTKRVLVADPLHPNPLSDMSIYEVEIRRVVNAILLGIVTYDANLVLIEPGDAKGAP